MPFSITILFADETRQEGPALYPELSDAAAAAFRLADELGLAESVAEAFVSLPIWVQIYEGDRMVISIQVISGGLSPN